MRRPQERVPEQSRGFPVGAVVAALAALACIIGGWYFWMHRTNPKDQALAVYKAYLSQDYKTAYGLSAMSPESLKKYPTADTFAADQTKSVDAILGNNPLLMSMKNTLEDSAKAAASTATVGDPVVNGDKADVPTSAKITLMGRSVALKGTAHMINDNGVWKLDMASDAGSKVGQARVDLIGRPDLSSLGGR